jgi:hypothetical protein
MRIPELRELIRRNLVRYESEMHEYQNTDWYRVYLEARRDAEYDILKLIAEPDRKEQPS